METNYTRWHKPKRCRQNGSKHRDQECIKYSGHIQKLFLVQLGDGAMAKWRSQSWKWANGIVNSPQLRRYAVDCIMHKSMSEHTEQLIHIILYFYKFYVTSVIYFTLSTSTIDWWNKVAFHSVMYLFNHKNILYLPICKESEKFNKTSKLRKKSDNTLLYSIVCNMKQWW